jgi:predicted amidophosphoribosyltransferase
MLVSNCCGYSVKVYGTTTKHYRCMKCWEPCDVEEDEPVCPKCGKPMISYNKCLCGYKGKDKK